MDCSSSREWHNDMSIDMTFLRDSCDGDKTFALEMLICFDLELKKAEKDLKDLLKTGPLSKIKQVAHKIKGEAATLGCYQIKNIATTLCEGADVENGEICTDMSRELYKAIQVFTAELEKLEKSDGNR